MVVWKYIEARRRVGVEAEATGGELIEARLKEQPARAANVTERLRG